MPRLHNGGSSRDKHFSIAATQVGGRPGVVHKQMTASQLSKTTRADARPRLQAISRALLLPIWRSISDMQATLGGVGEAP